MAWMNSPVLALSGEDRLRPSSSPSGARCAASRSRKSGSGTPALWTRVPPGCAAAPLGRTAMSREARRPDSLARTRPPGAALSRSGLSRALPEVGDTRGGRDRTHARTRLAPRRCNRSRIAFSRRTSRKAARNKPQRNSCQLLGQPPGSTASSGHPGVKVDPLTVPQMLCAEAVV